MASKIESFRSGRNDGYCSNLDVLRLLAVTAIVWIHSVETPTFKVAIIWCRFAVPAFISTSVWLLIWRHGGDSCGNLWNYAVRRAVRIYLLFLVWNGIYAAVRFLEHSFIKGGDTIRWSWETFLLAGFTEQLWFLPFLSAVTILTAGLMIMSVRLALPTLLLAVLLPTTGIYLAMWPSPVNMNIDAHPATYWIGLCWGAIPAALMVFGILPFDNLRITEPVRLGLLSLMFAIAIPLLWLSMDSPRFLTLLHNAAGVLLVAGAVLGPRSAFANEMLRALGSLALPVYLIHVLIVHAIQALGHRIAHIPVSSAFDLLVFMSGLVCSGMAAWFLLKEPHVKWLVSVR